MYDHVKRLASEADPFQLVLFSFLIKGHINSFTTQEAIVAVALMSLAGLKHYFAFHRPKKYILDSQIQTEINELKSALNALKLQQGLSQAPKKFF